MKSIRVCMISSLHGLYDDRIYWKEAISLKKKGYDVIHIGVGETGKDFISEHGIRLIRIRKKCFFKNPYTDKLFRIIILQQGIYKKIFKIASSLNADIYHFHDLQINRIGPKLKKLPHNPKVIYDIHEDYYELILEYYTKSRFMLPVVKFYAGRIKKWEKKCAAKYDFLIAAIPHIEKNLKGVVPGEKISVIYNYTNLCPDQFINYEDKKFDVLYSGLINDSRSGLEIAGAVCRCKKILPGITCLMVGPVPDHKYKQELIQYIRENDLEQNMILMDPVRYDYVKEFYSLSRIGLAIFKPIKIFQYSIQVKTFEYMAYGLPIVCSNFGNINKFVAESSSGITVNPGNPDEISKAITDILTDYEAYKQMSNNGILAAKDKYNWKSEEEKLYNIYQSL